MRNKGQSLFEVVLALAVVALITVGIIILSTNSIRNVSYSRNKNLSSRYAQEAVEWLRNERDSNTALFLAKVNLGTHCLVTVAWGNRGVCGTDEKITDTPFYREVSFTKTTINNKVSVNAKIKVYWRDAQGYHESTTETEFNDPRE